MPIYEYRCKNGHAFEVMQRMIDKPVKKCEQCSAPVERVFHPIAVHFKGSGFYNTDYGTRRRQRETDAAAASGADKTAAKAAEKTSKSDGGKADKPSTDKPKSAPKSSE